MADKTDAEKQADAENAMDATATSNMQSYTLDGMSVTRANPSDQIEVAKYFARKASKANRPRLSFANLSMS